MNEQTYIKILNHNKKENLKELKNIKSRQKIKN